MTNGRPAISLISSENIYSVFNAVLNAGNIVIIGIDSFLKVLIDFCWQM